VSAFVSQGRLTGSAMRSGHQPEGRESSQMENPSSSQCLTVPWHIGSSPVSARCRHAALAHRPPAPRRPTGWFSRASGARRRASGLSRCPGSPTTAKARVRHPRGQEEASRGATFLSRVGGGRRRHSAPRVALLSSFDTPRPFPHAATKAPQGQKGGRLSVTPSTCQTVVQNFPTRKPSPKGCER
jgi:hypothetical protein